MSEEILKEIQEEEIQEEPTPEPLPSVRCVSEPFDSQDPEHVRQWRAAGSPVSGWAPTFYEDLAEDGEAWGYVRRPYPQASSPLTASEMAIAQTAAALAARRQTREGALFNEKDGLVATIYYYLKNPCEDAEGSAQQMSAGQALVAGQGIGDTTESGGYGPEMRGWIDLGSSAFRGKIAGDTARPWFDWKPKVEGAPDKTVRQIMLDRIDAATNPS